MGYHTEMEATKLRDQLQYKFGAPVDKKFHLEEVKRPISTDTMR
jgi:hypothetical protein